MLLFLVEASLNKDQSLKPNPSQNKKNKEKKWRNTSNSHPVLFIQVALRCAVILLITSSLQI